MSQKFEIRSYTKKELALMYFPEATPHVAVNHLMRWIKRDPPLYNQLRAMGYRSSDKLFLPRQVALINKHFGDP